MNSAINQDQGQITSTALLPESIERNRQRQLYDKLVDVCYNLDTKSYPVLKQTILDLLQQGAPVHHAEREEAMKTSCLQALVSARGLSFAEFQDLFSLLVEEGASLSAKSSELTLLMRASILGKQEIAGWLLEKYKHTEKFKHKIDVNEQDFDGDTALHYAAQNNKIEVVRCLIDHGASTCISNKQGKKPLDFIESEVLRRSLPLRGASFLAQAHAKANPPKPTPFKQLLQRLSIFLATRAKLPKDEPTHAMSSVANPKESG